MKCRICTNSIPKRETRCYITYTRPGGTKVQKIAWCAECDKSNKRAVHNLIEYYDTLESGPKRTDSPNTPLLLDRITEARAPDSYLRAHVDPATGTVCDDNLTEIPIDELVEGYDSWAVFEHSANQVTTGLRIDRLALQETIDFLKVHFRIAKRNHRRALLLEGKTFLEDCLSLITQLEKWTTQPKGKP